MEKPIDTFVQTISARYSRLLSARHEGLKGVSPGTMLPRLEYLQRSYPSARDITLGIGFCRLALDEPRASEAFEFLSSVTMSPLARFFLLITRMRFGAHDRAFAELRALLRETAVIFPEIAFPLFSAVAEANRCSGWCAMLPDGRLVAGLPDHAAHTLILRHDADERPADLTLLARPPGYRVWTIDNFVLPRHLPRIDILQAGRGLLGSGIDSRTVWTFEGFIEGATDGLSGWCRYPNNLAATDHIQVRTVEGDRTLFDALIGPPDDEPDDERLWPEKPRTDFVIPWQDLQGPETPAVKVTDRFGRAFYGSPIDPLAGGRYARTQAEWVATRFPSAHPASVQPSFNQPFPTLYTPRFPASETDAPAIPAPRVAVIIPVYRGYETTRTCITLVLQHRGVHERVVIVNDCSPDERITAFLDTLATLDGVTLLTNAQNRGFTFSSNRGLRAVERDEDAILLNSDTLPPPHWIDALRRTVHRAPDIGTATPLSNAATIFSYPSADGQNPIPPYEEVLETAERLAACGNDALVEVPTAHGYCMYIRADCLHQTGLLREDVFAQGYGEENDFSRRAAALGWRHVACLHTFVGHAEGQSFSAVRSDLIRRNLATLNGLHPGYDRMVQAWQARDPLGPFRRQLDLARLHHAIAGRPVVALLTHDRQGGVQRFVTDRARENLAEGHVPLIVSPHPPRHATEDPVWRIIPFLPEDYPNITVPRGGADLPTLLRALGCARIEIHSYIGAGIRDVHQLSRCGIDHVVYLHDYSWFCPRITLVSYNSLYCGEPAPDACQRCVADLGPLNSDDTPLTLLRELSADLFRRATAIIASCHDVADRYRRHLDAPITLGQWEAPIPTRPATFPPKAADEIRRILLIGAIGIEKGYNILLALARHVADHDLPMRFTIIGHTCDDPRLLATDVVEITGRYGEHELPALIRNHPCDWGFLPAIWPETWSYILTEFWRQDIPVITFDIGAPAARIKATGTGLAVPLHLPIASLATVLLAPWLLRTH
ncbi:glycosyltransferase [Gluconacetobacter takamatsuzukensis]|uniref:Glycosyltransferase n=1 Tax=Gluconacetobacter takamatsuzukensis TaxID=1286190 RepID=A0A7W4KG11_9PROT|nr:glycosyltransferase [Gluconacetobacter takamatsuzukensis]MBB2206256.1 glycosyltransferase [Gluconacetobacter takamatsuzukensis]